MSKDGPLQLGSLGCTTSTSLSKNVHRLQRERLRVRDFGPPTTTKTSRDPDLTPGQKREERQSSPKRVRVCTGLFFAFDQGYKHLEETHDV